MSNETGEDPESKQVEVDKEAWNQGKYLQPDLYNQPADLQIVKPLETNVIEGKPQETMEILEGE